MMRDFRGARYAIFVVRNARFTLRAIPVVRDLRLSAIFVVRDFRMCDFSRSPKKLKRKSVRNLRTTPTPTQLTASGIDS